MEIKPLFEIKSAEINLHKSSATKICKTLQNKTKEKHIPSELLIKDYVYPELAHFLLYNFYLLSVKRKEIMNIFTIHSTTLLLEKLPEKSLVQRCIWGADPVDDS